MFIKKFDYLSPPITFYYQGAHSHTSIISGILSIISAIIIIISAGYYLYELIKRKDVNAFYFKSFIEDSGTYPINASSFFHFISLGESYTGFDWYEGVNFTEYRIIGLETNLDKYLNNRNIFHFNHWLYGICNNKSDTEGISNLINYKYFSKSACIRKYYDSSEQKYYDIGNSKFKWPVLSHGTFHDNNKFYTIIVENCKEETINLILGGNQKCIYNPLIELRTSYFYFINHYVDILNYKNPYSKFMDRIENAINKHEYYSNNLNICPSVVRTHNGYIFDNINEDKAYIYERNDVTTENNKEDKIYVAYSIWLKNTINDYERTYKRIQDVIPNIGGINQVVIFISICINKFYNKYIELTDTDALLFSSMKQRNKDKKKIELKNMDYKLEEINKEKMNDLDKKNSDNEKNNEKLNKKMEKNKYDNNISKSRNNLYNSSEELYHSPIPMKTTENKDNINTNNNSNNKYKKVITSKISEQNKTFCKYILSKLLCGKRYKWFGIYKNFRKKIISEEHLIKNYLNIYNLLKANENKKRFKRNSVLLKDLINLI